MAGYSKVDRPDPWYKSVNFGAGTHRDGDDGADGAVESGVVRGEAHAAVERIRYAHDSQGQILALT